MENNNNQPLNQPPVVFREGPSKAPKADYYKKTHQKVLDFLIGFFCPLIISLIFSAFRPYGLLQSANTAYFSFFANLIICIVLCVIFVKIGRRFITIGIISMCLVPILFLGGCLILLVGMMALR